MAWSSCTHARRKNLKCYLLWVAMSAPPTIRIKEEIERRHPEKDINLDEGEWYDKATTSKATWSASCGLDLETYRGQRATEPSIPVVRQVTYEVCSRTFHRESDKKRHKCSSERRKPVWEQKGAVQCVACSHWFRSKGRLTVHTSTPGSKHCQSSTLVLCPFFGIA